MDWGDPHAHDVLRERNVLHYSSWRGKDVDHELVDSVRNLCIPSRCWRLKRFCRKRHAIFCDPFGRAVVWTGQELADVPFADIENAVWPRYKPEPPPEELRGTAPILAVQAFHTRCWELTPTGHEITSATFKEASRAAYHAMKFRDEVKGGMSLNIHEYRVRRQRGCSPTWWDRLAEHAEAVGDRMPSVGEMARDRTIKWVSANLREIEATLELIGWPEWDVDDPPLYIAVRNRNSKGRRSRRVGRGKTS